MNGQKKTITAKLVLPHISGRMLHDLLTRLCHWLPTVPRTAKMIHKAGVKPSPDVAAAMFVPEPELLQAAAERDVASQIVGGIAESHAELDLTVEFADVPRWSFDGPAEYLQVAEMAAAFSANWLTMPTSVVTLMMASVLAE